MSREILFRGKRLDNGKWVYGGIRIVQNRYYIIPEDSNPFGFEVDPATVGQFTCSVDRNGKRVFECDIIGYIDTDTGETSVFGVVRWCSEGNFGINDHKWEGYNDDDSFCNVGYMLKHSRRLSIIGNIHDNPELLKGGEK